MTNSEVIKLVTEHAKKLYNELITEHSNFPELMIQNAMLDFHIAIVKKELPNETNPIK